MNAPQLFRMAAEHLPAAIEELIQERAALDARRIVIVRLIEAGEDMLRIVTPMVPSAGTLEREDA